MSRTKNYDVLLEMIRDEWGSQEIWLPSASDCLKALFEKINLAYDSSEETKK